MDNVLDISKYPYESNKKIAQEDRRIGLNCFAGIGSALAMLEIPYDSKQALDFVSKIGEFQRDVSYDVSIELAREKGAFDNLDIDQFIEGGFVKTLPPELINRIRVHGIRNCAIGTIAPVGTGSLFLGNISNGIEPIFSLEYQRKVKTEDGFNIETVDDFAYRKWKKENQDNSKTPSYFKTSRQISPYAHIDLMAVAQEYIQGNISKTVNLPESFSKDEYSELLKYSWKKKCRGFTSFREGTREGVLTETNTNAQTTKETVSEAKFEAPNANIERPIELSGSTFKLKDTHTKTSIYCVANYLEQNGKKKPWEVFLFNKSDKSEFYAAIGVLLSLIFQETDKGTKAIEKLAEISSDYGYIAPNYGFVKSRIEHLSKVLSGFNDKLEDKETKVFGLECQECGNNSVVMESGCKKCLSCGWSKC